MTIIRSLLALSLIGGTAIAIGAETREYRPENFNYPITKRMENPLFVQFDSPMYGCDSIGPLYTADASGHVWTDGRLYVYASHDMEPPQGCDRMDRYHVFSTSDMKNWTDHGEILNSQDVREQAGWGIDGWMWAPDCAYNPDNETYYFYFPHVNEALPWGGHDWRVGVATSKYPDHGFKVVGYVENASSLIDPCVFVDDDGQPYLYNGGGGQCMGARLRRDDWTKLDGPMVPMEGLVDFHEGTWLHKFNGKYYLSHSDNHPGADGNRLRYAVSDSPLGPWQDRGVYLYPTGCGTSHGSIVKFKNKWYALYHNSNYSGRDELRSVCIDPLKIDDDGTIHVVENWGRPFKKAFIIGNMPTVIESEDYNKGGSNYAFYKRGNPVADGKSNWIYRKDNIGIRKSDNGYYICSLGKKEWARYSVEVRDSGKYNITVIAKTAADASRFHISANGVDISGPVTVTPSEGWQSVDLPSVTIGADTRYLDFRVDNGSIDIDSLIIFRTAQ